MQNQQQNPTSEIGLSIGAGERNRTAVFSLEGGTFPNENKVVSCKTSDIGAQDNQAVTPEKQNDLLLENPVALALYNDINACQNPYQLDAMARLIWERYGAGTVNDDQASYLVGCIERRRPVSQRTKAGRFVSIGKLNGRVSIFQPPRQRQRSPDRKASRDRRRMLGGSSALPDNLRHHYTEGQRAVLCVVAGEIKRHGVCDFPIDKIAALAGVCRTTVQTAMHEAKRLGHISIIERPRHGRKNLSNLVKIASREWLVWIKRGPSAARTIGSNPLNLVSPTKSTEVRKEEAANEKYRRIGHGPPQAAPMRRSA